ncbi:MAG: hypothetical protein HOP20_10520 [Sulfuriferula sp.]|nr:hypothetical protein [Sulfuriferula sp.]
MLIFFDTEFTGLEVEPSLISIGLISQDGREFYAELSDTYQMSDCNEFVQEAVLPYLTGGDVLIPMRELTIRLASWLTNFKEPIQLCTDSIAWDWPWILELFADCGTWPKNMSRTPKELHQSRRFNIVVERSFQNGLRRHHALDDAKANRLGWQAVAAQSI